MSGASNSRGMANRCFNRRCFSGERKEKMRKFDRVNIINFILFVLGIGFILLGVLLSGCQSTSYLHTIDYVDGRVETIKVGNFKCLVFTDTHELVFQAPDNARLGIGSMTMDPQAAVDFAKELEPMFLRLIMTALGGK